MLRPGRLTSQSVNQSGDLLPAFPRSSPLSVRENSICIPDLHLTVARLALLKAALSGDRCAHGCRVAFWEWGTGLRVLNLRTRFSFCSIIVINQIAYFGVNMPICTRFLVAVHKCTRNPDLAVLSRAHYREEYPSITKLCVSTHITTDNDHASLRALLTSHTVWRI